MMRCDVKITGDKKGAKPEPCAIGRHAGLRILGLEDGLVHEDDRANESRDEQDDEHDA